MNTKHIINKRESLLSALKVINILMPDPLVLFVVDDDDKMVGTLTDGDSRRALIADVSVNDSIEKVMHKNFNFLRRGVDDDVQHLHEQKLKKMKLLTTKIETTSGRTGLEKTSNQVLVRLRLRCLSGSSRRGAVVNQSN